MNFEIRDGKERLPDEEDVYGVNDAEERDEFESLFGLTPMEKRLRRRKIAMRVLAVVVALAFGTAFALAGIRSWPWW